MNKKNNKLLPELRFPEFVENSGNRGNPKNQGSDNGEWEEKTLGEVGDFIGGGTPDTTNEEYWNGDILWFTPTEVKEGNLTNSKRKITEKGLQSSSAKILPIGALLITTRATIGDIGIATSPCTTNQGFQSLVVNDDQVNLFWYYWIAFNKNELIKRSSGSTFPEIGKNEIIQITALVPSIKEQKKIASCLSSLDEVITAQSQKLELLKDHKKGLMQNLFPTQGEKTPKLRFKEFKEEWVEKALGEVANVSKLAGYEFTKHIVYENKGNIIALRGLNIKNNKLELSDVKYIDNSELSKLSRSKLFIDDLMFTYIGTIGEVALIDENNKYYLAPNVSRIRADKSKVNPQFLLQYFNVPDFKEKEIAKYISSSSQPALTMENVRKFSIHLPTLPEQQKIASCLSALDELIKSQTEKIEQLKLHKKGLMQGLFPKMND
ncbi:restriction endonuclease subunit S [Fluviicola sp.]|jgi:type I restriction enzyme S subunit|uniref:restriction endonuclease subunit S n=1 Tax=Fluviicola sp. TaxID=1917219 RepID=UPI00282CE6A3|nr:restriction endonuclease subunit S [Fluviicola sp.]MDR0801479.1 restriction endonuclease subunit S [Fluviicola sp.]